MPTVGQVVDGRASRQGDKIEEGNLDTKGDFAFSKLRHGIKQHFDELTGHCTI